MVEAETAVNSACIHDVGTLLANGNFNSNAPASDKPTNDRINACGGVNRIT
jgi:hypothetical protein